MAKEVVWTSSAEKQLHDAFLNLFDKSQSYTITSEVIRKIYDSTKILATDWLIYQPDQLRYNNDGTFRAYSVKGYRVTYKIDDSKIYILRVRPSKMKPLSY